MRDEADITVETPTGDVLPTVMLSLLFILAVISDGITQGPRMPPAWPAPVDVFVAALIGFAIVGIGRWLNGQVAWLRPARTTSPAARVLASVGIGLALGFVIVCQVLVLAALDPGVRERYARFASEPLWAPLLRGFSAGVIEEVVFRYAGMAVIAVLVVRYLAKPQYAYRAALVTTAFVFGVLHLPDASIVGVVIVLFNGGAGILLGWLYWNWGVGHAVLAHIVAGAIIQSFAPNMVG
jgi:Type II CAAX prenyl endopeptidase Rce1-like